jgi:hypothetical protein
MSDRYGSITISSDASAPEPEKLNKTAPKHPAPEEKKTNSSRKGFFFAVVTFLCITSYFLAGSYLAPLIINKYLPGYIENKTGLNLSIGKIRLNPFNFHLSFDNIKSDLPDSIAKTPLLQIKSLFIDLDLTALIRNTFACDKLTIQDLQLNLIRNKDKTYNFPALSKLTTTQKQGEIIDFAVLPFLFSLNNIDINDSSITFTDKITEKFQNIEKLYLAIPTLSNFSFQSKNYIQPHFSAIINGSPIQLSGEAMQLPKNQGFQTKLSCSIESLDLVPYFSYIPANFPLALSKGRADTTLNVSFSPNKKQGDRLQIDMKMTATDIALKEKNSTLQITVPVMKIDASFMPLAKHLHINSVITKKTHLKGSRKEIYSTFQNLFFYIQKKRNSRSITQIDQLLSDDGKVTFQGDKTKREKAIEWDELQLSIRNYHSKNTNATFHLSGKHSKKQASFSWQGNFAKTGALQGKLLLEKLPAFIFFNQLTSVENNSIQGSTTFTGDINFPATQDSTFSYELSNGIIEIDNLKLSHKKATWLKAGSVQFTRLSRANGRFNLGNVFLKNAALSLNMNNLPPLYKHLFSNEKPPQIKGLDFSGTVHIKTEANQKKAFELAELTFQANKLDKASRANNFAFSSKIGPKGIIKAKGKMNISPLQMQADLAFSEVDSTLMKVFLSEWPLLQNSKATLAGKGVFHYPSPSFLGSLRLTDTTLQKTAKKPLIQWKFMELHKFKCNFSPFSLEAESIALDEPHFQWQRNSSSPFKHLQKGMITLFQKGENEDKVFPFLIKKVNFKNGSVRVYDKRLSPAWKTNLNNIDGYINNFNTITKGISSFTLNGTIEDAPLSLTGAVTLFSNKTKARAKMLINDFPLASLKKQLHSMPVKTKNAKLNLHINVIESSTGFSSKNEMLIKNIEASTLKSDTALALAFLKNKHNSFLINTQTTDGSRPLLEESIASFKTTTIKASYAPLLLDSQFKDLQDNNLISFYPGSNKIGDTGRETLSRYAALLKKHPELGLIVTGMADKKIDGNALLTIQQKKEQLRVQTENEKRLANFREKQKAPITIKPEKTLQEEDLEKDELSGFTQLQPKPVKLAKKVLPELAKERSLLVVDALTHSFVIAPERIMTAVGTSKNTNETPSNGVRITIKAIAVKQ